LNSFSVFNMCSKTILSSLIIIVLVGTFVSCNSRREFHQNFTFSNYQWSADEKLVFKPRFGTDQIGKKYQLQFNLRYIQGFPYKYLNLLITIKRPDGTEAEKEESIQIRSNNAEYIGDGMGSYWDLDYTVKEAFMFDQLGEYRIEITPIIDKSPVYFIDELGIGIISIENKK